MGPLLRGLVALGLLGAMTASAQTPPVALILDPGDGELRRQGTESFLQARSGDLLPSGTLLRTGKAPLRLWYCPDTAEITLAPGTSVLLDARRLAVQLGNVASRRALPVCSLPAATEAKLNDAFSSGRLRRHAVPEARPPQDIQAAIAALPASEQASLRRELDTLAPLRTSDPDNPALAVALAAIYTRYRLHNAAAAEYRRAAGVWTTVDWPRRMVHEEEELERRIQPPETRPTATGRTFALVIGVSRYPLLRAEDQLQFADKDAASFAAHLQSPRGGALSREQVKLLTNEQATTAAIRTAIATFLRAAAGPNDTVLLFLAAHGVVDDRGAYVLGYDSDPEDLATTALPMAEVQGLLAEEASSIGRVMMFIDVCRAGTIGILRSNRISRVLEVFLRGAETYGLLASGPGESSWESERFGGGHGAFSYFLLRGIGGDADEDRNRQVTADELFDYVYRQVRLATRRRQNPRVTGDMPGTALLVADTSKDGVSLADWKPLESLVAQTRQAGVPPPASAGARRVEVVRPDQGEEATLFQQAVQQGRILPESPDGAFEWLRRLRLRLGAATFDYLALENELYVSLLDKGQEVLLRYLRGEREPQEASDFQAGAQHFEAARQIDAYAWAVESRELFCRGRVMIFAKLYTEAVAMLERAARLDPNGAYIYNALGIAYLEQGQYGKAIAAFRDAIRLAPHWLYARHNLALAQAEAGDTSGAVAALRQALRMAPDNWQIRYSEGLLLQRMGDVREALKSFRAAIQLGPKQAEPWNALGVLEASRGKLTASEANYREAVRLDPKYLAARHNLALLHVQTRRQAEAVTLWLTVLAESPDFLPARLSLAETLLAMGRPADALPHLTDLLQRQPDYTAARIKLAEALRQVGRVDEALQQWQRVLQQRPGNPIVTEQYADALRGAGRMTEANAAYEEALRGLRTRPDRQRVQGKLRK